MTPEMAARELVLVTGGGRARETRAGAAKVYLVPHALAGGGLSASPD